MRAVGRARQLAVGRLPLDEEVDQRRESVARSPCLSGAKKCEGRSRFFPARTVIP